VSEPIDVVVVGGGGSGAPLASRLSEDPARRVLLLEAGPVPRSRGAYPAELLDAATVAGADPRHPDNWAFDARLTPTRPYSIARGRILGGSTTINGGYFERARPDDFRDWSRGGNDAWRPERVLPLQRRLENDLDYGSTPTHGGSGPMPVQRASLEHPVAAAFAAAAREAGVADEPDKNDSVLSGFGAVPGNAVDGVRWNTGIAYLLPVLDRPNLTVRGGVLVTRVVIEHGRTLGVETLVDGRREIIGAEQVILSAGAIGSPTLLLRSGIGPADELRRLGIEVHRDALGVGSAFGDHPQVVVEWQPHASTPRARGRWMSGAVNLDDVGTAHATIEILPSLAPMPELTAARDVAADAPLPILVSVQSPNNAGRLRLRSADPTSPPELDYGYLRTDDDRTRLRDAVRFTAELLSTAAFERASRGAVGLPEATLRDDRELDAWVAARLGTSIHTCGTAPFGAQGDPRAVVDQFGRVDGVDGLRVADTSILPSAPRRGPAATAVLIGELVAQAINDGS
jgi:predicted dehydrogenase (TIGR03970 family)